MRAWSLAALVLAIALAGCLTPGERLDAASSEEPEQPTTPPSEEASANDTDAASGAHAETANRNESEAEAGGGPDGNETDTEDATRRLPGNLSMEDAQLVGADDERVVFRWQDAVSIGVSKQGPRENTAQAAFDVPPDRWIEVNATVTGQDTDADLEVQLVDEPTRWCLSETWPAPLDGAQASCEVRPHPRPGWERWTVLVQGQAPDATSTEEAAFEVELTLRLVEGPWEAETPSRAPEEGWPDPRGAAIRPGAKLFTGSCTVNFVFQDAANDTLYAGTAAHCVDGWGLGAPLPLAAIPGAGRLAYCSWGTIETGALAACPLDEDPTASADQDNDLALIEIDPRRRHLVHPGLKHWGGPTGIAQEIVPDDRILTYGNSTLRDGGQQAPDPQDPREGYVCEVREWISFVLLASPSISGDSGSPVITGEGHAMGVMRSLGGTVCPGVVENGVSNLPRMLAFLEDNTDLDVRLATWPLEREPLLPGALPP